MLWWTAALATPIDDALTAHEEAIDSLHAESCAPNLQAFYDAPEQVRPEQIDADTVRERGPSWISRTFAARLALQDQLRILYSDHNLSKNCIQSARRADLAGRYLTDALYLALDKSSPDPWLTRDGSAFDPGRDLRSGDVLVTRGTALSSAGIAHMGRIDGQFSHNAMVHVDATGKSHTVEAYLERGALTQSVDDLMTHGVGRVVVLRYIDPEFAAEAARRGYERIAFGAPMDYDADFDIADHSALFCSEVVPWTMGGMMTEGPLDLPYDLTVFDKENNAGLFEAMGIEVDVTSAPVDVLYDPRFEIVAEWRDVDALDAMRRHDVVVESLFTWMETLDYRLNSPGFDRFFVKFGLSMRKLGFFPKRIHPRGDPTFLTSSLSLQTAGLALAKAFDEALEGRNTQEMTYQELRDVLDGIRAADLAAHERGDKSIFHDRIRPAVQ